MRSARGLTPRIRMVAGPNGSGKSTLLARLREAQIWLGTYLNADDIHAGLGQNTFETVMSHPSKVEFLARSRESGVRTYLYFVATEAPEINIDRVRLRVQNGGHSVPEHKVRERYTRSLGLLNKALAAADRAFVFDNSGLELVYVAEQESGRVRGVGADLPLWLVKALGLEDI